MTDAIQKAREALEAVVRFTDHYHCKMPTLGDDEALSALGDSARTALAALDAETEVKVRELEWTRNLHGITQWAETDFGTYAVDPTRAKPLRFMWGNPLGEWSTVDTEAAAKAAAQADFERRIRSALVTPEARS